jgi:hypothetical protein
MFPITEGLQRGGSWRYSVEYSRICALDSGRAGQDSKYLQNSPLNGLGHPTGVHGKVGPSTASNLDRRAAGLYKTALTEENPR